MGQVSTFLRVGHVDTCRTYYVVCYCSYKKSKASNMVKTRLNIFHWVFFIKVWANIHKLHCNLALIDTKS